MRPPQTERFQRGKKKKKPFRWPLPTPMVIKKEKKNAKSHRI